MRLSVSFYYCYLTALAVGVFSQSAAMALRADSDSPSGLSPGALRVTSSNSTDAVLEKELVLLENRFFFHPYALDPPEKRLERLELLTLGGSQYGSNNDRLNKLKASIVQRDRAAAQTMAKTKAAGAGSESNYPVLSTLEWRVLKKTYAAESLDQRLERLEAALFGLPSQAMSYVDRIDRLKKTVGVGVDMPGRPNSFTAISPSRGPMPRDFGGSLNGFVVSPTPFSEEDGNNFGTDIGSLTDQLLPENGQIERFGGFTALPRMQTRSGIGSINGFDFGSANSFFEQMQKPMADLLRGLGLTPYKAAPRSDQGLEPDSTDTPFSVPAPSPAPGPTTAEESDRRKYVEPGDPVRNLKKRVTPREELPPYSDPNSI